LSLVITLLKHANHEITVANITALATPNAIDSRVRGFPFGKYAKIAPPAWLNNGFKIAVKSIIGSIKTNAVRTAFLPLRYTEYANAQTSDIANVIGCKKTKENPITAVKYSIFTDG